MLGCLPRPDLEDFPAHKAHSQTLHAADWPSSGLATAAASRHRVHAHSKEETRATRETTIPPKFLKWGIFGCGGHLGFPSLSFPSSSLLFPLLLLPPSTSSPSSSSSSFPLPSCSFLLVCLWGGGGAIQKGWQRHFGVPTLFVGALSPFLSCRVGEEQTTRNKTQVKIPNHGLN